MASFKKARETGAPGIELDIHVCATGELVVAHDDTFGRTAGDSRAIEDLGLKDIRALDVGSFFGPDFRGEHPPLIEEVLEEFCPGMYIDIELKTRKTGKDPLPGLLAEKIRQFGEKVEKSITVSSFNPYAILSFKKLCPQIPTAIIWCSGREVPLILRRGFGRFISLCDYLKPVHLQINRFSCFVWSLPERKPIVPWTVDDPELAEKLLKMGCHGIISNRPQDTGAVIRHRPAQAPDTEFPNPGGKPDSVPRKPRIQKTGPVSAEAPPGSDPEGNGFGKAQKSPSAYFLIRHGSALSLLTFVSRILGLLREMIKASLLGTSALSDAFSVAFMIPNLFRRLFAEGSISVAFIPTFKEYLLENDRAKTREFLSCVLTFLSFFVSLAVVLGILASPFIISFFGMEEFDETVLLTRLMFPFLAFISLAALFQGILNSFHVFAPSGFAPIVLNAATILCAYGLSPFTQNPARAMAAGIFIGGFLEAIIQLPFVLKQGQRFFFTGLKRAINHPGTRKVLRLVGPTVVGMAAYQLNDLVSTALAGHAGEGIVSSLQYSLRLQELILGVFAVSIGTVLLPNLAEYAKSARWDVYNGRLISAMEIIALITIPVTFFSLAQGQSLIRLLFQNRSFDETSVSLTLAAFAFHMPGLFFIALNRILAPAFYAQSDSKSPTLAGIISFAANMILAVILVRPLRGAGIALALSLASVVNTALLLVFLRKNPNIAAGRAFRPALFYSLKLVMLSGIAVIPVVLLRSPLAARFAGHGRFISQGIPLAIAALVYGCLGIILLLAGRDKHALAVMRKIREKSAPGRGRSPDLP
jgi:putative peptidoglycan lipid II flippase